MGGDVVEGGVHLGCELGGSTAVSIGIALVFVGVVGPGQGNLAAESGGLPLLVGAGAFFEGVEFFGEALVVVCCTKYEGVRFKS